MSEGAPKLLSPEEIAGVKNELRSYLENKGNFQMNKDADLRAKYIIGLDGDDSDAVEAIVKFTRREANYHSQFRHWHEKHMELDDVCRELERKATQLLNTILAQ